VYKVVEKSVLLQLTGSVSHRLLQFLRYTWMSSQQIILLIVTVSQTGKEVEWSLVILAQRRMGSLWRP